MKLNAEEIASQLFENLWNDYSEKVPYAAQYAQLLSQKGRQPVIDHISFRTINTNTGEQPGGVEAISHILDCFGYHNTGKKLCADKLVAVNSFVNSTGKLPKILVSQLEVRHLPGKIQHLVHETVADTDYLISDKGIELLGIVREKGALPPDAARFLNADLRGYFSRPWPIPLRNVITEVFDTSAFCAWVLLHGNTVSAISANVNSQGVPEWRNIDETVNALQSVGVPFQKTVVAGNGSFMQSYTPPVKINTEVFDDDGPGFLNIEYSKFGLTERGMEERNGKMVRFDDFVFGAGIHFFDLL